MSSDPLRDLQEAARRYAQHVLPGSTARRLIILDEHRERIVEVRLPACGGHSGPALEAPTVVPVIAPETLAKPGWDVTGAIPRFDGTAIPIHGRKLDLLRVLVAATEPLKLASLRLAWSDWPEVEDTTIRWTLGDLRKTLRSLFPAFPDPVSNSAAGYWLTIR